MSTESLREVRDHFSEVVDRVENEHVEQTLDVLSDPDAVAYIREADVACWWEQIPPAGTAVSRPRPADAPVAST